MSWTVPEMLQRRARGNEPMLRWLASVPAVADDVCAAWGLVPDGTVMAGFLSLVAPVRDGAGRALVLKLYGPEVGVEGEPAFLRAAAGPGAVELVRADLAVGALLLERLDAGRSLSGMPDVDEACGVIGDLVRQFSAHAAPPGMRSMTDELDRLHASITAMLDRTPEVLPRTLADRALDTLDDLSSQLRAEPRGRPLVHGDLHFDNVLHTLPGDPERWVAIDPLPAAGYPEWDVVASLRNRWTDTAATDDPERALRRRLDILCDTAELDRTLATRIAQAVAVDNLLWLSRSLADVSPIVRAFVPPYRIIATWT